MKIIEITVSPTGETTVQTRGFTGNTCRDASRLLEQALGRPAQERLTAEYFCQQTEQQHLREGA